MKVLIKKCIAALILLLSTIKVCPAQTETKIPEDSLPVAVHNELHKKYARYHVNSIMLKTDKEQNEIYKVEVQKNTRLIRLQYDINGNLISKQKSRVFTYDGTEPVKRPTDNHGGGGHNH